MSLIPITLRNVAAFASFNRLVGHHVAPILHWSLASLLARRSWDSGTLKRWRTRPLADCSALALGDAHRDCGVQPFDGLEQLVMLVRVDWRIAVANLTERFGDLSR